MNDILSKIANNLKNEDVDEIAINDILQKVKTYWNYIGIIDWDNIGYIEILRELSMAKFLKAKFNDEAKLSIMQKTLVYRDNETCIFKPTDFKESSIIGEPICCFAYSQERWNEHYIAYQEAIYYVYDVIRDGNLGDFVAITIRPNGRALVLDKEHNWWSPSDSIRYINGLGDGSSVFKTKEGKSITTENKQHKTNKTMKQIKTITESKLRGIIKEAVKRAINENYNKDGTDYGWGSDPDKVFVVQCGETLQSLRKLYGEAQYVDKNLTGDISWCIERIHDAMMRIRNRRRN